MNDHFYTQLNKVFSTPNDTKTSNQVNMEEIISSIKPCIRGILDRSYKLDIFGEDTSLQTLQYIVEESLKRYVELESKPWLKDKLTVGFLGHINSGKTTALNCMFGETFSTSIYESTVLPTYLTYGDDPSVVKLVDRLGNHETVSEEICCIFDNYFSGGFPFTRFFDCLQKDSANTQLKKVAVLDTPGYFPEDKSSISTTIRCINLCDVIFWFVPVNGGLDVETISFLKDNISEKKLYFVFTFTDALGFNPSEVDKVIERQLEQVKSVDANIKGCFKFGRKVPAQTLFVESVQNELQSIISEEEFDNPLDVTLAILSQTLEIITERCVAMHKLKSEVEKDREQCMASLRRSTNSFCNAFNTLNSSYSNMISTFNRRCSEALGCGGASSAMATHINQCVNNINALSSAYNDIDFDDAHNFGTLYAKESLIENNLIQIEELKKEVENVLYKLKGLSER